MPPGTVTVSEPEAVCVTVEATPVTGAPWQCLRYEGLDPLTVDAIEKHIFLYHRRAVAKARQQQAT